MAEERTFIPPFLGSVMTLLFIFSTVYTLAFYYYQGTSTGLNSGGLELSGKKANELSLVGVLEGVLSFISWISPFALVRGLVLAISPSDLFQVLDMLILRPVSWIISLITANYLISKIPTISGET